MNKIISILMALIMFLTGCTTITPSQTLPPDVTPTINEPEKQKPVSVDVMKDEGTVKLIEDVGYKTTAYTTYPTDEYFYPVYVNKDGTADILYVNAAAAKTLEQSNSYYGGIKSPIFNAVADSVSMAPTMGFGGPSIGMMEEQFNTSEYVGVDESGFVSVKTKPLSTFAADVDTASYTNFRSIVRNYMSEENPYPDESLHDIRIEEMLNYFDYDYKYSGKKLNDKFVVSAEIGQTPWNHDTKLMVVNIKAYDLPKDYYDGSNLVFLIDTSGSMNSPDKFPLMKESIKLLVNELTEKDTVSIVTYSGDSATLLEGAKGSEKDKINSIIDELEPYGSTNGEGGIKTAYKIAEKYKENHSNNRIIMCSDGDLNVGMTSADELEDLVSKKRESGIYLFILGFGLGNYSDERMEVLADNGNGNYHYIDNIKEGEKVLVNDLMSTLMTIADDVKFQVEFNPEYIKGYRKIGYENRDMNDEDFANDAKDGGEVGFGHEVTIVYELIPSDSNLNIFESDLKYQEKPITTGSSDWLTLSIRYKNPGEKESNLIEYIVDESSLKNKNTEDWKFISDVVGFGLVVNDSEYKNDLILDNVIDDLKSLDLTKDEYKAEFYAIVKGYRYVMEHIVDTE